MVISLLHFKNALQSIFGSKVKAKVVETLAANPARRWTGLALAAKAGYSQPRVWKVLHELELESVVVKEQAGPAQLWQFNDAYFFSDELKRLSAGRQALAKKLATWLSGEKILGKARAVVLFGSVARGEERSDSDIDLLVVVEREADVVAVSRAMSEVSKKAVLATGCPVVPIVLSRKKFERKRFERNVLQMLKDGIEIYSKGAV